MIYDFLGKVSERSFADINAEIILIRLAISLVISAIIGIERSNNRHSAGLRTFMIISLTATVSMLIDILMMNKSGVKIPVLSMASVIGTVSISTHSLYTSSRNQIKGLTTSAALLTCCVLGVAIGAGLYIVAIPGFLCMMIIVSVLPSTERYLTDRSNHFEIHLELRDSSYLQNFVTTIRRLGLVIDDIEMNNAYIGSGLSVYSISISIYSNELKKYKTHAEIIQALRSLEYINHIEEIK